MAQEPGEAETGKRPGAALPVKAKQAQGWRGSEPLPS